MDAKAVIESVTERLEKTNTVRAVFGEPIETNTGVYIPVASVRLSGGGGGGSGYRPAIDDDEALERDSGMGLGLHACATPVGFIEITDDGARMVDVIDKNKLALGGLLIGGALLLMAARFAIWKGKHS